MLKIVHYALGIGGVSVYLDNGGHVIPDGSGLFHLSRVSAGMHLAKIDTLTLPPKSIPYDEGRARFYSSASDGKVHSSR